MGSRTADLESRMTEVFRGPGEKKQKRLIEELSANLATTWPAVKALCTGPYPPSVKRWAVEALGGYPKKDALPVLRAALRNPYMSVRLHALTAVRQLADPHLARDVKPLLSDASGGIRVNALAVIAEFRPPWLRAALNHALSDEKPYVRRLAQRLLATCSPARSKPLETACDHSTAPPDVTPDKKDKVKT